MDSLTAWLDTVLIDLPSPADSISTLSEASLHNPDKATIKLLFTIISSITSTPIPSRPTLLSYLKACKIKAISPLPSPLPPHIMTGALGNLLCLAIKSEDKKQHITNIMQLPKSTQQTLMNIINGGIIPLDANKRSTPPPTRKSRTSLPSPSPMAAMTPTKPPSTPPPPFASPLPPCSPSPSPAHAKSPSEIKTLQEQLTAATNLAQSLQTELQNVKDQNAQSSLALDLQTLQQHESETLTLTKTIDSLTAQNSALTSQLSLFDEAQATLQTLQDENDCMKHAASKLPQTEKQLSLAKDKIESLLSLKDQLAATEAAHAKALDKLLTLEAEITQVPTLKKQLETYKKKAAAADVTVEDLTGELKNLKKLSAAVQRQNTTLSISSNIQLQEAAELQRLLVESYGADDDLLTAIGAGVSELNPELSEELARLRSDNELLKNKLSNESADKIQTLADKVDDLERKLATYKDKFDAEKGHRKEDNSKNAARLNQMRSELAATKIELLDTQNKLTEAQRLSKEAEEAFAFAQEQLRRRAEANLALTSAGLNALTEEVRVELSSTETLFNKYKADHSVDNEALQTKQREYKHKLAVASSNISQLEEEVAQLTKSRRSAMIQQSNMQEEMDRLRKQGASMFGADSDMETQFEALQHEYTLVLEHNKKLQQEGGDPSSSLSNLPADRGSGNGAASAESLKSLTTSYETKISALTDEKRELIMNNTSAAKNLQMAETRSWGLEQEIVELKESLCELQLGLERAQCDKENGGAAPTPRSAKKAPGDDKETKQPTTLLQSVQTVQVGGGEEAAEPECKQS